MRRRRKHKPQDIWQQRAHSYRGELNQRMSQWEDDNIVATLAICALRRLLDGTPLEPGDVEKAVRFAAMPNHEIDRVRAIIERNLLAMVMQRMRSAITNSGRVPWTGKQMPEFVAVSKLYRDRMVGPWRRAFACELGDGDPLGMEHELE